MSLSLIEHNLTQNTTGNSEFDSPTIASVPTRAQSAVWPCETAITTSTPATDRHARYPIRRLEIDTLYAEFAPLVRRLLRQYACDDFELRQDLVGEIYWRFVTYTEEYDPSFGVPLRPYLVRRLSASVYTYVRQRWRQRPREISLDAAFSESQQLYLDLARRGTARRPVTSGSSTLSSPLSEWSNDPTPGWDDAIQTKQLIRRLPDLIAGLPKRQRLAVELHYYEHLSFDEIAGAMGVRPATARSLLRHGLAKLRHALCPDKCVPSK